MIKEINESLVKDLEAFKKKKRSLVQSILYGVNEELEEKLVSIHSY